MLRTRAAALALGPGCDTAFGTFSLITGAGEAAATLVKGGAPAEEDVTEGGLEIGGD